MSKHVFGAVVTHNGIAANNRGENDGNITTLQKLVWFGNTHTSVSAEAIRFSLRRLIAEICETNRSWDEDAGGNTWKNSEFDPELYADDDLLGFMAAEEAKEEREKGSAKVRRAILEISRAISCTPWNGDITFNAASIGATPSAAKKGSNPVPYGTEMHATRYQYGFAMTPAKLKKVERAHIALDKLCALGPIAGNNARFLFDFSPESIVLRITEDPSPRILYIFNQQSNGSVDAPMLLQRVQAGDIKPEEVIIGGAFATTETAQKLKQLGAVVEMGILKAAEKAKGKIGG